MYISPIFLDAYKPRTPETVIIQPLGMLAVSFDRDARERDFSARTGGFVTKFRPKLETNGKETGKTVATERGGMSETVKLSTLKDVQFRNE